MFDPLRLETGLIGNTDIEIRDAIFTNRLDAFDPTKLELHLTVKPADDEETTLYLGCGDGWETQDGGTTAVREDGTERNFHGQTKIGEFFGGLLDTMSKDAACDKAIRARVAQIPLGPLSADFWKGLNLHVEREKRKGGGDISDYEVLVVDGFNGIGEAKAAGGAKKAAGATKKAAKKAAPAKATEEAADEGVTDAIRATLDDIADASGSHDEFMEAAMAQVPEASTSEAVKAAVKDDAAGSIWQDAVDRYNATSG